MSSGSRIVTGARAQPLADAAVTVEGLADEQAPPRHSSSVVLGPRYLRYLAILLLLLGLFQRSELLGANGSAALVAVVAALAVGGIYLALRVSASAAEPATSANHYLVPLMAVLAAASVSSLSSDWRLRLGAVTLMAGAVMASSYVNLERFLGRERPGHQFLADAAVIVVLVGSYLAILNGVAALPLRLLLILVVSVVTAVESFYRVTQTLAPAVLYAVIVGQVTTSIGFGLLSSQVLDFQRVAAILLVAWYVNRGVGVHLLQGSLNRSILMEYGIGAMICVGLVAQALLSR